MKGFIRLFYILGNIAIVLACFLLASHLRGNDPWWELQDKLTGFLWFLLLYIFIGLLVDKYNFERRIGVVSNLKLVIYANLVFIGLGSTLVVGLGNLAVQRLLFYGTALFATILELIITGIIESFRQLKHKKMVYEADQDEADSDSETLIQPPTEEDFLKTEHGMAISMSIISEVGVGAYDYLKQNVPFNKQTILLAVNNDINIRNLPPYDLQSIVNLQKVNDHQRVNRFFETVNKKLPKGGIYAGLGKTREIRKQEFLERFTPVLGFLLYLLDFIFNRVMPKMAATKGLYFKLTKGRNRVMSRAEILGRLYSCGFKIIDETYVNNMLFFVAQKVREPIYDGNPTYGPLVRLRRIGKDKQIIGIYKLRTMHPYSEYIQHYVQEKYGLAENGKLLEDFRVTTWGKIFRKLWIDELPMIHNYLRGDLKLVGVRPLSVHKFNTYPKDLQKKRIKTKPGLIPPYYADMPKSEEEVCASESKYLDAYFKHPLRTDWKYFWKAFFNIVLRGARSA